MTGPGFRLINNSIQSRRFGVLCMGRDGTISQNSFFDNPGPSILLIVSAEAAQRVSLHSTQR